MLDSDGRSRRADQLPPGRHGLPREAVAQNQRERILRAVVDVASVAGYGPMVVEDIISTAGVSRRTFYDYFPNKEAAFLEAYDQAVDGLKAKVGAAYAITGTLPERTGWAVHVLVETLADDPAMAEMGVVEVLAAGAEAVERRCAAMERLSTLIVDGVREAGVPDDVPPLTPLAIVGGIHEVVYSRVLHGELERLRGEVPEIVRMVFLPYVGRDAAAQARDAAAAFLRERREQPAEA
ncbi:TetR/AcrR family transcriptional regulator [Patulibacter sp. S7RM1-6]